VKVAIKSVRLVPYGTITAMVDPLITPSVPLSEYAVIVLAVLGATVTVTV